MVWAGLGWYLHQSKKIGDMRLYDQCEPYAGYCDSSGLACFQHCILFAKSNGVFLHCPLTVFSKQGKQTASRNSGKAQMVFLDMRIQLQEDHYIAFDSGYGFGLPPNLCIVSSRTHETRLESTDFQNLVRTCFSIAQKTYLALK